MKKLRFLCIAPYEGMFHLMSNIAQQRSDVELIIRMGNLDDGLKAVLENRDESIDAIISRGGTTEAIRQHVDIPACDILPSVYDVLRTIRLAYGMGETFAVLGYPSITKPAEMLCDIMQYQYEVCTIHSPAECEQSLRRLRGEGIRIIVGDMISVSCAKQLGMQGLLIVSGQESVEAAIDSAREICQYHTELGKRVDLFADLLRSEEEDYLLLSSDGRVVFSTTDDLPGDIMNLLHKRVSTVIAQGAVTRVLQARRRSMSVRGRLLRSGGEEYCLYTISYRSPDRLLQKQAIQYYSADSELPPTNKPLEYYLGSSALAESIVQNCGRYAAMKGPVIIEGAEGTGKDRFAHYIHSCSPLKHSSFLMVDSAQLDEKDWLYLFDSNQSPLTNVGMSVYFRRIDAAAPEYQRFMWTYLKNAPVHSNRLFFSCASDSERTVQEDLYLYLTEGIHCLRLSLPELRQRRGDIPKLVSLYINAINVSLGTRVIGFTHEAMLMLQNFDWPRNADQLYEVVHDLVIRAESSYISDEQVASALTRSAACHEKAPESDVIDLNRSLEEITRDVVMRVYAAENMNQSRTAKHLNISRSTLWRMLQKKV